MNIDEIKTKVNDLANEYGSIKNACIVIGNIKESKLTEALHGNNDTVLAKIDAFFTNRKEAFSKYTDEQISLIKEFEKLIISKGSLNSACLNFNFSAASISNVRNGKYNGDIEKVFSELREYKDKEDYIKKTDIFKKPEYVPTSISETAYEYIRKIKNFGICGVITGDAGIGKTKAARKFLKDNPQTTIMITIRRCNINSNTALRMIANELGIKDCKNSNLDEAIINELHDGMVIIIDEAQKLNFKAIDDIRTFSDYFSDRGESLGIAFIGNQSFLEQFEGERGVGKEQVWSRLHARPHLRSSKIPFEDIKLLFPLLTDRDMIAELKFLHCVARSPKEDIRAAMNLFAEAYNAGDYTLKGLVKQAKIMNTKIENIDSFLKNA